MFQRLTPVKTKNRSRGMNLNEYYVTVELICWCAYTYIPPLGLLLCCVLTDISSRREKCSRLCVCVHTHILKHVLKRSYLLNKHCILLCIFKLCYTWPCVVLPLKLDVTELCQTWAINSGGRTPHSYIAMYC